MVSEMSKPRVIVEFVFDFGSPNAYYVHKVVPDLEATSNIQFQYVPCLLGGIFKATGNQSPVDAYAHIKNKLAYEHLESARFCRRHGILDFQQNPHFPVNTLLLMRGAIVAQQEGREASYIDACFHHMWEAPKKMDDPKTFVEALDASGFDGGHFLSATNEDRVKTLLIENTQAAIARGVFGVPTFFVGSEMFFGKDRLAAVCREVDQQIPSLGNASTGKK